MNRKELDLLEQRILVAVAERRKLGAYDTNAEAIMFLTEWVALIIQHLNKKPAKKKKKEMTITLKKYVSELFRPEINLMVGWLNDPETVRYSEQRHKHHTYESQLVYIEDGPDVFREIYAEDYLVGTVAAYIDRNNSVANVGILIGKEHWSKGYGTEAWTAFCDSLFETGIRKIEAGTMIVNQPMVKIFHKYKMELEAIVPEHFIFEDLPASMTLWGRFREAI